MGRSKLKIVYPVEVSGPDGGFSRKRLTTYYEHCAKAADEAAKTLDVAPTKHDVLLLVDLQGVYLGFTNWLKSEGVPLDGGTVASRLAHYMLNQVSDAVSAKIVANLDEGIARKDIIRALFRNEVDKLPPVKEVVDIRLSIELFYAPLPIKGIEWQLRKQAREGSAGARQQLLEAEQGRLTVHGNVRDYSVYEDFIAKMKMSDTVSKWEEGFFNYFVSSYGLKSFDEKEVDTRLTIRAVDACVDYEADSICIISSDQDFTPLHQRGDRSGVKTYQADVSKFATPEHIGRRIRDLGDKFIPVGIDPSWAMRALCEASGHDPFDGVPVGEYIGKGVTDREFKALCDLHNRSGLPYQLEPNREDDGSYSLMVITP